MPRGTIRRVLPVGRAIAHAGQNVSAQLQALANPPSVPHRIAPVSLSPPSSNPTPSPSTAPTPPPSASPTTPAPRELKLSSTTSPIENMGSSASSVTIAYNDATSGNLLMQKSLNIAAGSFLGEYTPADLTTAGTRATAVLSTTSDALAVIVNEGGTGRFMSYDAQ